MTESPGSEKAVDRSVADLTRGISVDLQGLPGSGRTRALREICEQLVDAGWEVVAVPGISMPSQLPLAAFVASGVKVAQARGVVDTYGAAADLARRLGPQTVLVVDDVDMLDDESVAAVLTARHRARTPLLVTSRPTAAGSWRTLSTHLTPSDRVPMGPLRHDEVDQLLRNLLQIALEPSSLGVIINACGGLPGLVLSTTEALVRRGSLREVGTSWRVVGPLWSGELSVLVEQYLLPLDDESLLALHLLAVAGTMSLGQARQMPVWPRYRSLEAAGLVHVLDVRGTQEIVVYPPLLAEYFNHEVSELARAEVEELLHAAGIVPRSRLAYLGPSPATGRETTLLSHRVRVHWEDEVSIRRVAWLDAPSPWTAVRYVIALGNVSADSSALAEVVAATPMTGSGLSRAFLRIWWACHLAVVQQRPAEAIALLQEERVQNPELDGALRAIEAHVTLITRGVPDPALLADPGPGDDPASADFLRAVRAEVFIAQGMQRQAHAVLDGVGEDNAGLALAEDVARGMAIFLDGDIDEALVWAAEHFETSRSALDVSWSEGHAYLVALILALTGRLEAFDAHMATVASLASAASINVHMLAGAFALASVIATDRGMRETAVAFAEQARGFGLAPETYPGFPPELAYVLATEDHEVAASAAWAATEQRLGAGYVSSAVLVGMIALEYDPDEGRAGVLRAAATATESPLLEKATRYAVAIVDSSPERLQEVSRELAEAGLVLYATRAAVRAAHLFRAGGDPAAASAVASEIWSSLRPADAGLLQLLRPLVEETELTDRELQIAALLGQEASAQEIADQLVLSVRTIEQHILRACRKLGISRRSDLAELARTWLAPFLPPLR